jgi:hypothetical protein
MEWSEAKDCATESALRAAINRALEPGHEPTRPVLIHVSHDYPLVLACPTRWLKDHRGNILLEEPVGPDWGFETLQIENDRGAVFFDMQHCGWRFAPAFMDHHEVAKAVSECKRISASVSFTTL